MSRTAAEALEHYRGQEFGAGGIDAKAVVARFGAFFEDFGAASVRERLERTYAENLWFDDSLKTIEGRAALLPYFEHTVANVDACRVAIDHFAAAGEDLYLRWRMEIEFRRFQRGKVCKSQGMTHLRVNEAGLIILHQDYWDAARGFFEMVPVIGYGIRMMKARL